MKILLTRPKLATHELQEALEKEGHTVLHAPLLEIRPLPVLKEHRQQMVSASLPFFILTSANAIPFLQKILRDMPSGAKPIPVFTMSQRIQEQCAPCGKIKLIKKGGTAQELLQALPGLLSPGMEGFFLSGTHVHLPLDQKLLEIGIPCKRFVAYHADFLEMDPSILEDIRMQTMDVVVALSVRTMENFLQNLQQKGLLKETFTSHILLVVLSSSIASASQRVPWREIRVAPTPDFNGLLLALKNL